MSEPMSEFDLAAFRKAMDSCGDVAAKLICLRLLDEVDRLKAIPPLEGDLPYRERQIKAAIAEALGETRYEFQGAIIAGLVRSILDIAERMPDRKDFPDSCAADNFYAAVTGAVARACQLRRWAERSKNPFGYLNPIDGLDGEKGRRGE